jgi:hypothetical protein
VDNGAAAGGAGAAAYALPAPSLEAPAASGDGGSGSDEAAADAVPTVSPATAVQPFGVVAGGDVADHTPRTIVVHAMTVSRHTSVKATNHDEYFPLRPWDAGSMAVPVVANTTLEVDVAQFWCVPWLGPPRHAHPLHAPPPPRHGQVIAGRLVRGR